MGFSLPAFALKRPVTITMMIITVIGLGVIAWQKTPLKFMPEMEFPFVICVIPYFGATPEQVEKEVAIPAEGEFRTIANLRRIRTFSGGDGCEIFMRFDWEADMGVAVSDVRDRVERLKLVLPDDIDHVLVQQFDSNSVPVLAFAAFREGDEEEFAHMARKLLRPRMIRLPGVADVEILSKPEKEILIQFDQNVLASHNLPLYQVVAQLQTSNLNVSVGEMVDANSKYIVRVLGEMHRPEQLGELVVGPHSLRLKDVAEIGYEAREVPWHHEIDGKGGVLFLLRKESEANTVATCLAVHEELKAVKKDPAFEGADFFVFFDQSEMILVALSNLIAASKYGGCMALAVLFLFLRRVRLTLLVALAIPSSLVCAMVFMFLAGMTLNVITMISLIVAIGMLVDNSIVVIENIQRYRQLGYAPAVAAERGASEVALAITSATITTVVVFIPSVYMETGEMATYMREFAAPMIISLSASLLIALTVIPLATSRMKRRRDLWFFRHILHAQDQAKKVAGAQVSKGVGVFSRQHLLNAIISAYARLLHLTMRWRLASMVLLAALLALTYLVPYRSMGAREVAQLDLRHVNVHLEFEQNFDMEMARERFAIVKNLVDGWREELGVKTIFTHFESRGGEIELYLLELDDMPYGRVPPYTTEEVMAILEQRLPGRLPGAEVKITIPKAEGEGDERTVSLRFRGDDSETLARLADQFKWMMEALPDVENVRLDTERDEQEVRLQIDEALAERAGISPFLVARTVDVALRGARLPYMKQGGREVPVWAQFREEDRKKKANLDNVGVMGERGIMPVNQLVEYTKGKTPARIQRIDGKNTLRIRGTVATNNYFQVQAQLRGLIRTLELPVGYSISLGDEFERLNENLANFAMTVAMAVILIYLVMSALFESLLLPLSILTAVPLSFVGVYWMMWLTGTAQDVISYIGCILMVGIVVNNGIVIIDHINNLRKRGVERHEAVIQSGKDRFRPVMMTAITTILGCLPLAIGGRFGSRVTFMSLGRALIGGLTTGTVLTLFVVPLFYSFVDDLSEYFTQYFSSLARLAGRAVEPVPPQDAEPVGK